MYERLHRNSWTPLGHLALLPFVLGFVASCYLIVVASPIFELGAIALFTPFLAMLAGPVFTTWVRCRGGVLTADRLTSRFLTIAAAGGICGVSCTLAAFLLPLIEQPVSLVLLFILTLAMACGIAEFAHRKIMAMGLPHWHPQATRDAG